MEKKYLIAPTYSLLGRKFLTWQEAEDLAYWENLYYGLSLSGHCGPFWQRKAMLTGFPNWTLYFSEEKTVSFFFKCEGLV